MIFVTFYWNHAGSTGVEAGNPTLFDDARTAWHFARRGMHNNNVTEYTMERSSRGRAVYVEGRGPFGHVTAVIRTYAAGGAA